MAQDNNIYEKSLTVPQFKALRNTQKIYFNPLVEKGTKAKVFYKDKDGNITTTQRVVATDDANNIIANVSRAVAEKFLAGQPLPSDLAVGARRYEATDENGQPVMRTGFTIYQVSNLNRTEVL